MSLEISVRSNVRAIERSLDLFIRQQIPFATAQALSQLAKETKEAEQKNLLKKMPTATPFTQKSIGSTRANKASMTAQVFVRDIAAAYLEPYEFGGLNKLNGAALLKPENVRLNKYGNLPRRKISQLLAKPNVFAGKVKLGDGSVIDGIWQRPARGHRGALKLLIRFADAHPAKPRLGYRVTAERFVQKRFNAVFGKSLARAMATAK